MKQGCCVKLFGVAVATVASDGKTYPTEALTVSTLLIAKSDPKDKERIIGLIILLLERK